MMSVLEYAQDVDKKVDTILRLCKKLNINVEKEEDMLSEEDIINLDNSLDLEDDFDLIEKAEAIALESDLIEEEYNDVKTEKIRKQAPIIKKENKEFLKDKKAIYKHKEKLEKNVKEDNVILYHQGMTVKEVAEAVNDSVNNIIKKLMGLGMMANLNQSLEFDVVEMLVIDYGKTLKKEETRDISNFEQYELVDDEKDLVPRPPVVTIMGHVDHGKTTLLDYIRKSHVAEKEAGGITQAIGAYQVDIDGRKITFIDTPGHEAFTEMRARGASVTDIVIIIVAANDGVKPQTKEAIAHAKAAKVPIIVAINKIDLKDSKIDRVMEELTENGLTPEEWGGDTLVNKISAKSGEGVKELLENVLLVADMEELKANPNRYAAGTVIEARLDKNVGAICTLLVQNGTLRLGDPIVVGNNYGKVRTLKNDKGENIVTALPSTPIEVTGLNTLPVAGDKFMAFETEKEARKISEERINRSKEENHNRKGMTLEDLFSTIKSGVKEINVILKADVKGSEEAVKKSLEKINVEGVRVNVISSGTGAITESDILLADASKAIIIGFNIRPNNKISDFAEEHHVDLRLHNIIYKVTEELEQAMIGMLDPEYEEKVTGEAEVRQIFKFSKVGNIAGCNVTNGVIKNGSLARIIRDGVVIYSGKIGSLQRGKDKTNEVKKGLDCGITVADYQDIKEKDIIETYEEVEIKR